MGPYFVMRWNSSGTHFVCGHGMLGDMSSVAKIVAGPFDKKTDAIRVREGFNRGR